MGVAPGDRVAAYMPNVPETAVAMMATLAIGAVWSSAAPEFGVKTVVERFGQIEPKILFAVDGYRFAGRDFKRESEVRHIVEQLPTLDHVVWLPYLDPQGAAPDFKGVALWSEVMDNPDVPIDSFRFERVAFDHPLWVMFSSGTTGLPKAIVHSHVGALVEHLKLMHFHMDLKPDSVMFFYTTTGWMMWNVLLGALLTGATVVLYDGSPVHPGPDFLWKLAAEVRRHLFRREPNLRSNDGEGGSAPGRDPRSVAAAICRRQWRAELAGDLRVVLPMRQARPVGDLAVRRHRDLQRLRRRDAAVAGLRRRDTDPPVGFRRARLER